ncbi:transcriptional regulator, AraC family [Chloroherpeton thalassium ATCC 35110]|uniref:Transcriptional regulator, AraC family n=1 Tax=Chloroherpeton thalassium (strain ATCC 35110 / GB-78) TaxID=517418 RepID=B3QWD5_CHLT3|nr:AraC family transcriptional regulator [Chloroherpeton thalassium]ACF13248.1 transcriptional regulator, AraC family [Chloroherpeton thalassium ATCC 35110]
MHFKNISDLFEYEGLPVPENPLLGMIQFNRCSETLKNKEVSYGFYTICLQKIESGEFWYGKTKYDSDKGFMYFLKPNQKLTIHDVVIKENGFTLFLHEDYLMGYPLYSELKKYNYFDYEINEALHLSPREKEIMWSLFHKMDAEYTNNPDEFSKSIILSHLDSMLKYALRFYKRQFIDRKPLSGVTVTKFTEQLNSYFETGKGAQKGLPTVNYMATQLNLSSKYMSDLLKQETGKTALELIHLHVISEAKNLLVSGEQSIAEIAYKLGFDNPPYFSRLFKKETGMSPKEFKTQIMN